MELSSLVRIGEKVTFERVGSHLVCVTHTIGSRVSHSSILSELAAKNVRYAMLNFGHWTVGS